jgi:uncharacterized protein (DUF1800 family)
MGLRSLCAAMALFLPLVCGASPALALDVDEARHFLLRTGFGATAAEIERLKPLSRAQAIRSLLDGVRQEAATPPPDFMAAPRPDWQAHWRSQDEEQKSLFNRARDAEAVELKAWWWREILTTKSPFTERMVLFWHNHFTSSMDKVRAPDYLFRQNALFRRLATGSFATLLHEVARDPAMVRYLDSSSNRKAGPNENFARELLELFTLGEGHYGEADIKAAARAFAGWHNDERAGVFRVNARELDDGAKTFLGRSGNLTGEEVIDILLAQQQLAPFVVRKLWREFVSDEPEPAEIDRLARLFRAKGHDIGALMEALLASPAFWDMRNRAALVKSPVELLAGAIRQLAPEFADTRTLVEQGRRMRQDLFNPPNVRGWPGGTAWISTEALLMRREALARLLNGIPAGKPFDAAIGRVLLATEPVIAPVAELQGRQLVEALVLDPAYQVK